VLQNVPRFALIGDGDFEPGKFSENVSSQPIRPKKRFHVWQKILFPIHNNFHPHPARPCGRRAARHFLI